MPNKNLNAAKKAREDEFYTQMKDIERELQHYWPHFKGKTVLCNCDDPYESNFFKYFALHFNHLGLRKLICTCYNGSPVQGKELLLHFDGQDDAPRRQAYKVEITEVDDYNGDGAVDLSDVRYLLKNEKNVLSLLQSGDFRSQECIELLQEADLVVTNPPFSLFREYIAQLMKYKKHFLIIGNLNAVTFTDFFPLIRDDIVWLGFNNDQKTYICPDGSAKKMGNTVWYTNLDIKKRHEFIDLVCRYSPEDYPSYDNYNAIHVARTAVIPYDYSGVMGVPISMLYNFCPNQFELLGITDRGNKYGLTTKEYTLKDAKNYSDLNRRGVLKVNGVLKSMYARLLIRNKHPKTTK